MNTFDERKANAAAIRDCVVAGNPSGAMQIIARRVKPVRSKVVGFDNRYLPGPSGRFPLLDDFVRIANPADRDPLAGYSDRRQSDALDRIAREIAVDYADEPHPPVEAEIVEWEKNNTPDLFE